MKEQANNRMMGKPSRAKAEGRKPPLSQKITCSTCLRVLTDPGAFTVHMASCKGKTR
jgi:hypothetical protein